MKKQNERVAWPNRLCTAALSFINCQEKEIYGIGSRPGKGRDYGR